MQPPARCSAKGRAGHRVGLLGIIFLHAGLAGLLNWPTATIVNGRDYVVSVQARGADSKFNGAVRHGKARSRCANDRAAQDNADTTRTKRKVTLTYTEV